MVPSSWHSHSLTHHEVVALLEILAPSFRLGVGFWVFYYLNYVLHDSIILYTALSPVLAGQGSLRSSKTNKYINSGFNKKYIVENMFFIFTVYTGAIILKCSRVFYIKIF